MIPVRCPPLRPCFTAVTRSHITFADLAAGVWHGEGRGAQQLRACHQAAVNLAFLASTKREKAFFVAVL